MNEKFLELSQEKQLRIVNAGLEVFGQCGYQKANTDDIAVKAGISKGLLFHYFQNKKSFYMYLYQSCEEVILNHIIDEKLKTIDDFFELIDYASRKKLEIMTQYPSLMNFIMKALYSQKEDVTEGMNEIIEDRISTAFSLYFQNIDFTRFKEGSNPQKIYQMLMWMAEGYLIEKERSGIPVDINDIMIDFEEWKEMFKKMCYKEEYL